MSEDLGDRGRVRLFQPWVVARIVAVEVGTSGRHPERVEREGDGLVRQAPGVDHPRATVISAMTLITKRDEVGRIGKQLALVLLRIALGQRHLPKLMLGNDVMQGAYSVSAYETDHESRSLWPGTRNILRAGRQRWG